MCVCVFSLLLFLTTYEHFPPFYFFWRSNKFNRNFCIANLFSTQSIQITFVQFNILYSPKLRLNLSCRRIISVRHNLYFIWPFCFFIRNGLKKKHARAVTQRIKMSTMKIIQSLDRFLTSFFLKSSTASWNRSSNTITRSTTKDVFLQRDKFLLKLRVATTILQ